jgi:hypothetical protein
MLLYLGHQIPTAGTIWTDVGIYIAYSIVVGISLLKLQGLEELFCIIYLNKTII